MQHLSRDSFTGDSPITTFGNKFRQVAGDAESKQNAIRNKLRTINNIDSRTEALNLLEHCDQTLVSKRDETGIHRLGYSYLEKFKNETARMRTFDGSWPEDIPVSKNELAKGGWFYTGCQDKVQCPWCRGIVYNWEKGDTALGEHAKYFPSCPFLKQTIQNCLEPMMTNLSFSGGASNYSYVSETYFKAIMELGYTMQQILDVVKILTARGITESSLNTDVIMDEILKGASIIDLKTSVKHEVPEINDLKTNREQSKQRSSKSKSLDREHLIEKHEKLDYSTLKKQTSDLKKNITCKICLDEQVVELFLPCRHLVCCVECSVSVSNCPLCRERIVGTIKTFI